MNIMCIRHEHALIEWCINIYTAHKGSIMMPMDVVLFYTAGAKTPLGALEPVASSGSPERSKNHTYRG